MSSNFQWIQPGDTIKLVFFVDDGDNSIYPQATVYDSSNTLIDTINLSVHASIDGLYTADFTPPSAGHYNILYIPYSDSGRTTIDYNHGKAHEPVLIRHMPASFYGGQTGISKKEIDAISNKVGDKVWEYPFETGRMAKEELMAKSEFDPENQVVKIAYDFQKNIDKVISTVAKASAGTLRAIGDIPAGKDYTKDLQAISAELKKVGKIDLSEVNSRIESLAEYLNEVKEEIKSTYVPFDTDQLVKLEGKIADRIAEVLREINSLPLPKEFDYRKLEELKNNLLEGMPEPQEFDYDEVKKVGEEIKKEIKDNKPKEVTDILANISSKIDDVNRMKLLVNEIYNNINQQHQNLLAIIDRLVGRLEKMDSKITGNQNQLANLISDANRRE